MDKKQNKLANILSKDEVDVAFAEKEFNRKFPYIQVEPEFFHLVGAWTKFLRNNLIKK